MVGDELMDKWMSSWGGSNQENNFWLKVSCSERGSTVEVFHFLL
jgi:hypothetical protein